MNRIRKLVLVAVLLLAVSVLTSCGKQPEADFSQIRKIAELSVYKCYYHNVAEFSTAGFLGIIGNKKAWIEYTGTVTIGIDPTKVKIDILDDNTVGITLPPVEVSDPDILIDQMREPVIESGWLAKVTLEEKNEAVKKAQETMLEAAKNDPKLLAQGKERAKLLLENFVHTVGNQVGKTYRILWVEGEVPQQASNA